MVSTLMASQSCLFLQTPKIPTQLSPNFKPLSFSLKTHFPRPLKITSSSITSSPPTIASATNPKTSQSFLTGSTRTLSTLFSLALSLLKLVTPPPQTLTALSSSVSPLFFAAVKDRPPGYLNTPLTVVAAGLSKWLDIYSGVLMVRVLLSWFPNIPWDRQPLSAIRDLCDPYLNLFRNIIPPIFDTLDISPLLAFAVLGVLGSVLNSRGAY